MLAALSERDFGRNRHHNRTTWLQSRCLGGGLIPSSMNTHYDQIRLVYSSTNVPGFSFITIPALHRSIHLRLHCSRGNNQSTSCNTRFSFDFCSANSLHDRSLRVSLGCLHPLSPPYVTASTMCSHLHSQQWLATPVRDEDVSRFSSPHNPSGGFFASPQFPCMRLPHKAFLAVKRVQLLIRSCLPRISQALLATSDSPFTFRLLPLDGFSCSPMRSYC